MDKKRLEYYKKKLLARRDELLKTIARTAEEGRLADEDPTVDLADKAAEYREALLDTALSVDTVAMEEYFEKGDVSVETLKRCIKQGAISGAFTA